MGLSDRLKGGKIMKTNALRAMLGTLAVSWLLLGAACGVRRDTSPIPFAPAYYPDMQQMQERPAKGFNTETYDRICENPFLTAADNPLSTFSIDVDTASYSNVRRFLHQGEKPPPDAVRIEELINYFRYDYPEPRGQDPFAIHTEVARCPWAPEHLLVQIGLKARDIRQEGLPPRNLVFLIDVSGSMADANKLPLLKQALRLLSEQLTEKDTLAMVVYAGSSGLALPPTRGDRHSAIAEALERLEAGGSTNGGAGIELAYRTARENFIPGGVNRVILATDGDFNVGVTNQGDLTRLIEKERESKVFLSVLGFGMGNLKDSTMEKLADTGNGNYAYIDTLSEARKVLVHEATGTLITVAKDVKIQVEFNPARVEAYRLIGYENRLLRAEDFNDDRKDAGEMGAGHSVTAIYEVVPAGAKAALPGVDPLRYQTARETTVESQSDELLTLKARYKDPTGETSRLLSQAVRGEARDIRQASDDLRHAAAVAAFGMLLRGSEHKGCATLTLVRELAESARGRDPNGYRAEFLELVEKARRIL
jgi:Ca-activated chloride channel family protein